MNCPYCNKPLKKALIISECTQPAEAEQRDGYVMLKNIQPPTSIDATINVLCGECTMVIEDVEFRENFDSQLNKS